MARIIRALAPVAALGVLAVTGCAAGGASERLADQSDFGTESNPVQLGVVGASDPYWALYQDAVEEAGISIEIVDFAEYTLLNPALSEGELDINQFQHIQYLADYNVNAGDDLQPIGSTAIYPLGLYSTQYESVEDIPDGETVIVPNDTVNQARGLLVLQSAGLITLEDGGNASSALDDIVEDESRVSVEAVNADLTATSLPDVAAAIVNNDFLDAAGLGADQLIATDDPNDPNALPYVNIFVTRSVDADNEVLNQLVDIYQSSQNVLDSLQEQAGGTAVFLQIPAADLQASLVETQDAIEAQ